MLKTIAEGEGDLSKSLDVISRDEIGDLSEHFNHFLDRLKGIILNIKDADVDDSEYCRQIKEKFCKVGAPVIVTSTISARQFEERASDLRAIHYFQKPYPLADLLNTACEVLKPSLTPNQAITFH